MNKKGFTLVEVLAVIVLLSLIITIVATNGFGAFNNTKKKIKETTFKEIAEGTKVFLTDVENCDEIINADIFDKIPINDVNNNGKCDDLIKQAEGNAETDKCIEMTLSDLQDLKYVSSQAVKDIEKEQNNFKIRACLKNGKKEVGLLCLHCDEQEYNIADADIKLIDTYIDRTLAKLIIRNAKNKLNGTEFVDKSISEVGYENNFTDEKILSITEDDFGDSYYFRGNVKDNYVNFANMCWRIVRIVGDGSIKLVLEDINETCNVNMRRDWVVKDSYNSNKLVNFGYSYEKSGIELDGAVINFLNNDGTSEYYDDSLATALKYFQVTYLSEYLSNLKSGGWCLDDSVYYVNRRGYVYFDDKLSGEDILNYYLESLDFDYFTYVRYFNSNSKKIPASLICYGTILNQYYDNSLMYVGALTADEVAFAGHKYYDISDTTYYLSDYLEYYYNINHPYWLMTPDGFYDSDYVHVMENDDFYGFSVDDYAYVRPVISLKSGISASTGNGTIDNPYVIE